MKNLLLGLFFYTLFLKLYQAGITVASIWNIKARLWRNGRQEQQIPVITGPCVWIHCSSLGEFEQGRPLIEAVKHQYPGYQIVLTFFSPSGYEIRKNYSVADHVLYLPMDGRKASKEFITRINPALVLWVKYEYWYYYLTELKQKNIPVLLVSGIFREEQPFFKSYGGIWKQMLASFEHLFVQNDHSLQLLKSLAQVNVTKTGDTRFDRVTKIAHELHALPVIEKFCKGHPVIVCGSTWDEDEEVLMHYAKVHRNIKFIIAPHEIDNENLQDVHKEFPDSVFYSDLEKEFRDAQVLIIDNIGMLSRLYKYATITYVGGGFRNPGIHNILEAAVYAKPVIFGPVYEKFDEAKNLVMAGGAFSIETALELESLLDQLLNNETRLKAAGNIAGAYVTDQCGATQKIMEYIYAKRLLTS